MRRIPSAAIAFAVALGAAAPALADSSSSGPALALAALAGVHDPAVKPRDRRELRLLLDGSKGMTYGAKATIVVKADKIVCRAGNVDITYHDCRLTFGTKTVPLKGRAAHEIYATLVENGVPSDGAAGSVYESVSSLACAVTPAVATGGAGGGADCTFSPGP
ncbi:MAG: hypothetical protein KGI57_13065 [Hyphomicrobiales bacterium]|nr:hypothetical protein [Hyphomicrobiales bacterium]